MPATCLNLNFSHRENTSRSFQSNWRHLTFLITNCSGFIEIQKKRTPYMAKAKQPTKKISPHHSRAHKKRVILIN